ncbi:hypothetical protein [Halorientalis pallida]|uniref:Uncharacterized protein n=1 Tax=Halorientalis pallida TaxID=2479928 RepID=A0A498L576_9EURY|nr:hypothetical protein [Halorientalis pallida]RXK49442.1 hypothetical protein EAF64_11060 [Halorientalis pallida]
MASVALLITLCLVGAVGPASAVGASSADAQSATDGLNRTLDGVATLDATRVADGGLVLGGATDVVRGNASLTKLAADGSTAWTREFETANRSGIVAVEAGPDGSLYFLQFEYPQANRSAPARPSQYSLSLVRATADGTVTWRQPLDVSRSVAVSGGLAVTDTGPALVSRSPDGQGLELTEFEGDGTVAWNRTYDVRASPRSLTATDDGFLLVGSLGFSEPWVLRTDEDGTVQLNRSYETIGAEQVAGAVPVGDGFVFGGAYSADYGDRNPWAARVGADGVPRWSRVYPSSEAGRVQDVFGAGDGVTLVGNSDFQQDPASTFVGVGTDGTERYVEQVAGVTQPVVVPGSERQVTVVGWSGYPVRNGTVSTVVRDVTLPEGATGRALEPDARVVSGERYYRGQNLRVPVPKQLGETVELVRVPGEYDDFDPRVVRRIDSRPGLTVVESATLEAGQYYVRTTDGDPVLYVEGDAYRVDDREDALFEIDQQSLSVRNPPRVRRVAVDGAGDRPVPAFRDDREGAYVDRLAGETTATVTVESERSTFDLWVSGDRFAGERADGATLRAMFDSNDGFEGVETVGGTPAVRLSVTDEENLTIDVEDVEGGLYDLRFRATDTGDGGAAAETRVVVGPTDPRPVTVTLNRSSLTLPVEGRAVANVTVAGLDRGIGAMSMSALRVGAPAIDLSVDLPLNGSSAQSSAGWSDSYADADAQVFGADTANGTVTVGTLAATAQTDVIDPDGPATNTVRFQVDWIVDASGRPYTIPGGTNLSVTVENVEAATGGEETQGGVVRSGGSASGSVTVRDGRSD